MRGRIFKFSHYTNFPVGETPTGSESCRRVSPPVSRRGLTYWFNDQRKTTFCPVPAFLSYMWVLSGTELLYQSLWIKRPSPLLCSLE
jgi:hypothetical protein